MANLVSAHFGTSKVAQAKGAGSRLFPVSAKFTVSRVTIRKQLTRGDVALIRLFKSAENLWSPFFYFFYFLTAVLSCQQAAKGKEGRKASATNDFMRKARGMDMCVPSRDAEGFLRASEHGSSAVSGFWRVSGTEPGTAKKWWNHLETEPLALSVWWLFTCGGCAHAFRFISACTYGAPIPGVCVFTADACSLFILIRALVVWARCIRQARPSVGMRFYLYIWCIYLFLFSQRWPCKAALDFSSLLLRLGKLQWQVISVGRIGVTGPISSVFVVTETGPNFGELLLKVAEELQCD